jgi:hypothetical protein
VRFSRTLCHPTRQGRVLPLEWRHFKNLLSIWKENLRNRRRRIESPTSRGAPVLSKVLHLRGLVSAHATPVDPPDRRGDARAHGQCRRAAVGPVYPPTAGVITAHSSDRPQGRQQSARLHATTRLNDSSTPSGRRTPAAGAVARCIWVYGGRGIRNYYEAASRLLPYVKR